MRYLLIILFSGAIFARAFAAQFPSATPLAPLTDPFQAPARVAVDAQGQVYVTDPPAGKVVVLDAFNRVSRVKPNLGQPLGIAVNLQGGIYVGNALDGTVTEYDANWNQLRQFGQGAGEFQLPGHIAAMTTQGVTTVFVSDSAAHSVKAYRDGVMVGRYGSYGIGPNQFSFPAGIWASPEGKLYIVDQENDRIQVLDGNGAFLRQFPLQSSSAALGNSGRAQGIAGDTDGRIYVTDSFQGYVKVYDVTSGSYLGTIGSFGETIGQLRSPGGIVLDNFGRLWVADTSNGRVAGFGLECSTQLTLSPATQTVAEGTTVTFLTIVGCSGDFAYQWYKNQVALVDQGTIAGSTHSTLTLSSVSGSDTGDYSVVITGANGVVTSPSAGLTVISRPIILGNPVSRTVSEGTTLSFNVVAQGTALNYQWLQGGVPLASAQSSILTFPNVQPWATGAYSVRVSNAAGVVTSAVATLTVNLRPVITEAPVDQIVANGTTASIAISATGSPTLTYQWWRNGTFLSGQTQPQVTLTNATSAANGVYLVRVANSAGYASASARFAVNLPESLTVTSPSANALNLSWGNPFYLLQTAPSVTGPWQTLTNSPPVSVPADAVMGSPQQYFRLFKP